MKILNHIVLAALLMSAGLQPPAVGKARRSARQPFPERGFWVAETAPDHTFTTIRYYANSNYLVSEVITKGELDVTKLSVRKYLNEQLRKELEKDTTAQAAIRLYEIR